MPTSNSLLSVSDSLAVSLSYIISIFNLDCTVSCLSFCLCLWLSLKHTLYIHLRLDWEHLADMMHDYKVLFIVSCLCLCLSLFFLNHLYIQLRLDWEHLADMMHDYKGVLTFSWFCFSDCQSFMHNLYIHLRLDWEHLADMMHDYKGLLTGFPQILHIQSVRAIFLIPTAGIYNLQKYYCGGGVVKY